jgi:hypothetical protein
MRALLALIAALLAANAIADITTRLEIRSEQVKLAKPQHKAVGWKWGAGGQFDRALGERFARNGFAVADAATAEFQLSVISAVLTRRPSGELQAVNLSDLDDATNLAVPAYKPFVIKDPTKKGRVKQSEIPFNIFGGDAASTGSIFSMTGSVIMAILGSATVTYAAHSTGAKVHNATSQANDEGGDGLLQISVLTTSENGAERTEFTVSASSDTECTLRELLDAAADGVVQVLTREKPATPEGS